MSERALRGYRVRYILSMRDRARSNSNPRRKEAHECCLTVVVVACANSRPITTEWSLRPRRISTSDSIGPAIRLPGDRRDHPSASNPPALSAVHAWPSARFTAERTFFKKGGQANADENDKSTALSGTLDRTRGRGASADGCVIWAPHPIRAEAVAMRESH
jgi:hypothetical protein